MKKTNIEPTRLLAALVLAAGLTVSASAQQPMQNSPPATADTGPGLVGSTYSQVTFGYQTQQDQPTAFRDYQFLYNESLLKTSTWGIDGNFTYDYLTGDSYGAHDYRNEALAGFTAYALQSWGKPFVTADGGYAWEHDDNVARKSYAYNFTGGVEIQVLKELALTPFLEYQAEPHLFNHELPIADIPDHMWNYGVMATYRITRQWNASAGISLDDRNRNDWGYRGGLSYRF